MTDFLDNPYIETVFERKLKAANFSADEIEAVKVAIRTTCTYCWDTETSRYNCYCTRHD